MLRPDGDGSAGSGAAASGEGRCVRWRGGSPLRSETELMAKRRGRQASGAGAASVHEIRRRVRPRLHRGRCDHLLPKSFTDFRRASWSRSCRRRRQQQGDTVVVPAARGTDLRPRRRARSPRAGKSTLSRWQRAKSGTRRRRSELLHNELDLPATQARSYFTATGQVASSCLAVSRRRRGGAGGIHGFYFEPTMRRFYPHGDLAQEILGTVNLMGTVAGGIEQEMDSVLAGRDGRVREAGGFAGSGDSGCDASRCRARRRARMSS